MNEWPDDRLDELFRKSAEEHNPSFEPADWDNLRKRLDATTQPTRADWLRKWWPWGAVLLLLLTSGGLSLYYWSNSTDSPENKVAAIRTGSTGTAAESTDRTTGESNTGEVHQKEDVARTTHHNESKSETLPATAAPSTEEQAKAASQKILPRSQPDAGGVRLRPSQAGRKEGDGAPHWNRKETASGSTPPSSTPALPDINGEVVRKEAGNDSGTREMVAEDLAERDRHVAVNALLPRLTFQMATPLPLPSISRADSGQVAEPLVARPTSAPKWAVRLGVSPDMSSVGLTGFTNPGPAASLLVEYAVVDRLYVQSGIIRSLKTYRALPGQYEWPSYWTQYIRPVSVDGDCHVLEVPLNLRYDWARGERSVWFAGAGVSSYHMQKEVYKYNYERPDPSIKRWRWEGQTGWYWLSHLNASAGYEYRFSNRLSLLAEPYVRVPLRRVGYGKVNLFTAGVWMSVRYTPVFRK